MDLHFNISSAFTRWVAGAGLLHEDFVVLDVGVQGGESPRWHLLGDHLVVHGLDAIKEVVDELQARNRDNTRRRYHWIAAGKEDGEATLYFNAADPCSSSLYAQSDDRFGVTATRRDAERRVPMRRIDGMIAEGLIPMPDFIKIDVEGHEQDVLLGARGMRSLLGAEIESNFGISTVYPTGHFATLHGLMLETRLLVFDIAFNRVPRKTYLDALGALSLHPEGEVGAPATLNVLFCRNLIDDGTGRKITVRLRRRSQSNKSSNH